MGTDRNQPLTSICSYPKAGIYTLEVDLFRLKVLDIEHGLDWALLVAYNRGKMESVIDDLREIYSQRHTPTMEHMRFGRDRDIRKGHSMKQKQNAVVLSQKETAADIYDMWIETSLAHDARPGQFLCVYPRDKSMLLPRPISICEADAKKGAVRIVYRIAGAGTREFSGYRAGDAVSILGTLGNGFPVEEGSGKRAFLIGGGIGIPPLLELAKRLDGEKQVILGYRSNELFLQEDLEKHGAVYVATEDGSAGSRGNVMDAIRDNGLEADIIYACGPMPMLRAVKKYAAEHQIKAYISLEERMACGVGVCLGCVAGTKEPDHHSHVHNARICTDGPVFEADAVEI